MELPNIRMARIPEPHEVMGDDDQAEAYATSDFAEVNQEHVNRIERLFPSIGRTALDIGAGDAELTIRFAKKYPETSVIAVDGSEAMLSYGQQAVVAAGLEDRIELQNKLLQDLDFPPDTFDFVMANSLLHHIENPHELWNTVKAVTKPGGAIYLADLTRPHDEQEAGRIVEAYSEGAPKLMKRDFYNSLLAAFTPEEVEDQLREAGLPEILVDKVSDRHIVVHGIKKP